MKFAFTFIAPVLLFGSMALGQMNQPAQLLGARQQVGPASPVVQPDGRVTFNLLAPDAKSVSLNGDHPISTGYQFSNATMPMTKDDKGVWSVTVGPLTSDFYSYSFVVDGVRTLDPQNVRITRDGMRYANWAVVPGTVSENYQISDVPHGQLREVWYASPSLKLARRMFVYTPPTYDDGADRFPVFYLLHGGGGDEEAWTDMGRAPEIFDNLIAQGKMVPMIVVMGNGNSYQAASPNDLLSAQPEWGRTSSVPYAQSIVTDMVPFVDKHYRTKADRDDRAIAGLSMGGGQTLYAAFNNLDVFSWVGVFSGGLPTLPGLLVKGQMPADAATRRGPDIGNTIDLVKFEKLIPLSPALNTRLHLLYMTLGKDDGLVETWIDTRKLFDERGVKYTWVEVPGYGHEWSFWRQNLQDFAVRIFKAPAK